STADQRKYLKDLSQLEGTVVGLNNRGEMQVVNGLPLARLEQLNKEGLEMLPAMGTAETGYWNPIIVTDKAGKAEVTFRLPERSTAWQLQGRGVTKDTLAGETELEILTKKDLFGEIKTPLAFMQGDKAQIIAEVHNAVIVKGETINVSFSAKSGEKTTELRKAVVSQGPGVEEVQFPITLDGADKVEFTLTVESGQHKDTATMSVPVQAFGLPVYATAAGTSAQNTIAMVGFDKNTPAQNPTMEIVVGATINRALIDAVLNDFSAFSSTLITPTNRLERSISDVLGGTAVLAMLRGSQTQDSPEGQALAGRVQSGIASLVSSQKDDGSWSWSGKPSVNSSDRFLSSRAVWALAEARKAGFAVPQETWTKAIAHLKSAFTASRQSDLESQAILLHGLSMAKAGDFAFANRLYRERNSLSASGLLHLALSLIELDRKSMAEDLLKMAKLPVEIEKANQLQLDTYASRCIPWMQSNAELRALYLLALEEVPIAGTNPGQVANWLMAARQGMRWTPEKVNGPAITALARWYGRNNPIAEKYQLAVFINGRQLKVLEIDPDDGSHRLEVPAELLTKDGEQKINFDITGRGQFSYSVVMQGFVPAEKLTNTTKQWSISRSYEPAQLMFDGKPVKRGFDILSGSWSEFHNPLTQLPLGERGDVTLHCWRKHGTNTPQENIDYLILTEPIPAGTMVLTESIRGNFERYELSPGAITFFIGNRNSVGLIRYQIVGYLPGEYRTLPTLVRSFYRPERMAVSQVKTLSVLDRDQKSKDEYRLSPVELYELGKLYYGKENYAEADDHLTRLFRNHSLDAEVYKQTVEMLFNTSLKLGKDQYVVEYFEIIKEKYPDVEIDFENILRVAKAYRELGEYERSFLVYRATVEARFERESQIAGFLKGRNEFLNAFSVLERLLHEYPAESYIAINTYALAGEVYGIAESAGSNPKLKEAGVTRIDLIAANIHMLDHFLSTWPDDPAADAASFTMANSLLDLEQFEAAIARCRKFAERYPKSKLLDSFWYVIGYSQFALGKHQDALKTCEKVASTKRKDAETGIEVAATNKWQAIYIMGQIYHSLGQPAKAIDEYKKVDDRFPDADEAIEFFTRKEISLPEISTIRPKDAKTIQLKYRNMESVQVKVYRIDLMKFGLMQRNLDRITAINLAGIKPYHELTLKLGDGKDFQDREKPLTLPLKEEGAYLVVCRGENLYSSGLVLISPFDLEIQEDAVSGRVRVTVKNAVTDQYADDVHVKTIGSANDKFVSGETDLRG
ncbi:MAG: tetratricopeptide repeat protein, partial [Planctomycetaceae bacterium]|nr:tetratricopeptide repeat protein [Planctomycetaceae bacterium]